MSRNRHIRKALLIGIIQKINKGKNDFSFNLKIQPKWINDLREEKLGKPVEIEVFLEDEKTIERYERDLKQNSIILVEGELKNYRWQDGDIKKKRLIIGISKFDGNISILNITKESDMPYLNKIIIIANGYKAYIRKTNNNGTMGIFPCVTEKTWRDKNSGELVKNDEWLDICVFNENLLLNLSEGEHNFIGKVLCVEASLQSSPSNNEEEKRNTIAVAKRMDNKFIVYDIINNRNAENNNEDWQSSNKYSNLKNNREYNRNQKNTNNIDTSDESENELNNSLEDELDNELPF